MRVRVIGVEFLIWVATRVACCGTGGVSACTRAVAWWRASWSTAAFGVGRSGGLVPLRLFGVDIYVEPVCMSAEDIMM
jgi:hypothetical protein